MLTLFKITSDDSGSRNIESESQERGKTSSVKIILKKKNCSTYQIIDNFNSADFHYHTEIIKNVWMFRRSSKLNFALKTWSNNMLLPIGQGPAKLDIKKLFLV